MACTCTYMYMDECEVHHLVDIRLSLNYHVYTYVIEYYVDGDHLVVVTLQ